MGWGERERRGRRGGHREIGGGGRERRGERGEGGTERERGGGEGERERERERAGQKKKRRRKKKKNSGELNNKKHVFSLEHGFHPATMRNKWQHQQLKPVRHKGDAPITVFAEKTKQGVFCSTALAHNRLPYLGSAVHLFSL